MWLKKTRLAFLIVKGIVKRYYILIIGCLFMSFGVLYMAPSLISLLPSTRPTEKIGIVGIYNQTQLPDFIIKKISIGLTTVDEQGNVYPGFAHSWYPELGGKTWVFDLDQTLTWSDQKAVVAKDIQYKFQDVETQIVNEHTIKFTLPEVFAPFPSLVSNPLFRVEDKSNIGFGPYRLNRITTSAYSSLKQVKSTPISEHSTLPNLEYNFYPTEEAAKTAFKLGEIDSITELDDVSPFDNWPTVEVSQNIHSDRYTAIMFNMNTQNADLKTKQVRQGLAYAITDKSFGYQRTISTIPARSWAFNPTVKTYDYDEQRAKEYLDREKNSPPLKFTLTTTSNLYPIAEKIVADWAKFGVEAEISVVNELPETIDVLLAIREIPTDPDQYSVWHSTQVDPRLGYQNPKIDKLIEDGRKTIDIDERRKIYQDFQRFLNEDVPAIFLYHPTTYALKRK